MSADDVTSLLNLGAAALGGLFAVGRFVLAIVDAVDERWPRLKPLTNWLGTFLGGRKERYAD